jgi:hypothetical protein
LNNLALSYASFLYSCNKCKSRTLFSPAIWNSKLSCLIEPPSFML